MDSTLPTYPLTLSQLLVWSAEKLIASPNNILSCMARWNGPWVPEHSNHAIQQILRDNEGLRLRLIQPEGEVRQYVAPYRETPVSFLDFSYPGGTEDFQEWAMQEAVKRFEILDRDLFNFTVIRLGPCENGLFLRIHHLIADGWSITLIFNQFFRRLQAPGIGKPLDDSEPDPVSFVEFVNRQTAAPRSLEKAQSFFTYLENLTGTPATWIQSNPPINTNPDARRISFTLPETLRAEILRFSQRNHSTAYLFFLTGTLLYLSLVNRREDAAIGTLFHNRMDPKYQETIGMFSTILPLRVKVEPNLTFQGLLNRVLTSWKQSIGRHPILLSMADLMKIYQKANSLFDIMLGYENHLPEQPLESFNQELKLDPPLSLALNFYDHPSAGIRVEFLYRTEVLTEGMIEETYNRLIQLWTYLVNNPEAAIGEYLKIG